MTSAKDVHDKLSRPKADRQPPVTYPQWLRWDSHHRASCAPTEALKAWWLGKVK
jgi:hypothetical protein